MGSWWGAAGSGCGCGAVWVGAPGVGISRWPGRGKRGLAPAAPRGALERRPPQGASAERPGCGNMTGDPLRGARTQRPRRETAGRRPHLETEAGVHSGRPRPSVYSREARAQRPPWEARASARFSESQPSGLFAKPESGEFRSSKLQVCASLKPRPSANPRSHDPALSPGSRRPASGSPQLRWVVSPRGLGPVRPRGIAFGPLPARPQPMPAPRNPDTPGQSDPSPPGPGQCPPRGTRASLDTRAPQRIQTGVESALGTNGQWPLRAATYRNGRSGRPCTRGTSSGRSTRLGPGPKRRLAAGSTCSVDPAANRHGGRYWDRTSDLFGVNEALSR